MLQIVEEGPVTVAPPAVMAQLEQGARQLAQCVGYQGAATVEYLYSLETQEHFFLELNPRLQVRKALMPRHLMFYKPRSPKWTCQSGMSIRRTPPLDGG
jgi:biotin carboxylase